MSQRVTAEPATLPMHARFARWLLRRSSILELEQHYVVSSVLSASSTVLDLGANVGRFSRQIIDLFGCQVVAIEPEQANFDAIPVDARLQKIQGAIGGACGKVRLTVSEDPTGHHLNVSSGADAVTETEELVTVYNYPALVKLLEITTIDLMKIDVEGSEWDWLDTISDQQLSKIGQLTIEFHDFVPELREKNRTWANYQRLMGLGFHCIEDPEFGSYNVLFVNPRFNTKSWADRMLIPLISFTRKLIWKAQRVRKRAFGRAG